MKTKKIPSFNLDYTFHNDKWRVSLNGLYIGMICKYYKNDLYQFVPKGFHDSFLRKSITLRSFPNHHEVLKYVRRRLIKRYIKYGTFL